MTATEKRKTIRNIALIVMSAGIWLFWSILYNGHLHAAEEESMFLFTSRYAKDMILHPGGLADYIGAFLTQFFYLGWAGGLAVAIILVSIAAGIGAMCRNSRLLPLTAVPPLILTVLLVDSKWAIASAAGISGMVWTAAALSRIKNRKIKTAAYAVSLPFLWQFFLRADFYKYADSPDWMWWALVAVTAAVCIICSTVKAGNGEKTTSGTARGTQHRKNGKANDGGNTGKAIGGANDGGTTGGTIAGATGRISCPVISSIYIIMFLLTSFAVSKRYEALDEEIFRYAYLVRLQDWNGILELEAGGKVNSPLSTNAVNLALLMNGKLLDEMFLHYQNGPRSLVNFEERKFSSEILFQLGFVNEAIHLAFEDMAGNPSRERGTGHITRLARYTAVDSCNAKLCERYLATLDRTLFYRNFDTGSNVTPDMEPTENFFFDFTNFENMLYLLSTQRPHNDRVRDYLAASLLIGKNLKAFALLFSTDTVSDVKNMNGTLPLYVSQALQVTSALGGAQPSEELQQYMADYDAARGNGARMGKWKNSYWYYYNFK